MLGVSVPAGEIRAEYISDLQQGGTEGSSGGVAISRLLLACITNFSRGQVDYDVLPSVREIVPVKRIASLYAML